ncbi:unnamed protein product [Rotaria socialis]|nr:unnamed protein product [Rotaria socialis]CAF4158535.1 unnamed protein product [Rotaria socialis]CAF4315317.1 unnamed protein product [Rotaria socialis]CAF4546307.1 unnamed protein product [Rotaria socialis]CAF4553106.1 unnamed protein product [Rotaria socialis]
MMAQTRVLIKYGPYKTFFGVEHKTERTKGLETFLTNLGYSVSTHPIPIRNACEVHVYDLKVFECDIRNLQFGGDGELDDLCHETLRKITDVTSPSSNP